MMYIHPYTVPLLFLDSPQAAVLCGDKLYLVKDNYRHWPLSKFTTMHLQGVAHPQYELIEQALITDVHKLVSYFETSSLCWLFVLCMGGARNGQLSTVKRSGKLWLLVFFIFGTEFQWEDSLCKLLSRGEDVLLGSLFVVTCCTRSLVWLGTGSHWHRGTLLNNVLGITHLAVPRHSSVHSA